MRLALVIIAVSFTASLFANRIWIEKDNRGIDSKLRITIDAQEEVERMRSAFPNGFDMVSYNPIDQAISVACTNSACEVTYADEKRDYGKFLDSGLRQFDFNSEIAIQFYQALAIEPKTWNLVGQNTTEKFFALGKPARMYFRCTRSADNPQKWPHCHFRYYTQNLSK